MNKYSTTVDQSFPAEHHLQLIVPQIQKRGGHDPVPFTEIIGRLLEFKSQ